MIDLTKSTGFIEGSGRHHVTVTEAKNDYTKNGLECVFVTFEDKDGRTISASYTEKMYWKLDRLAQAAGLTEAERKTFEPEMLLRKSVVIETIKNDKYTNVNEVFSATQKAATNTNYAGDMPF